MQNQVYRGVPYTKCPPTGFVTGHALVDILLRPLSRHSCPRSVQVPKQASHPDPKTPPSECSRVRLPNSQSLSPKWLNMHEPVSVCMTQTSSQRNAEVKNRSPSHTTLVFWSAVIWRKFSLGMLRVRPEDQRRQYRVHKPTPNGYPWDIVSGSVVFCYKHDIPDDVEESE